MDGIDKLGCILELLPAKAARPPEAK
jgi:hypothetical protein